MIDAERHPWDRRPSETSRAHEAFRRFRDIGPLRTLDVLVDPALRISRRTLHGWSLKHDWTDRAHAWDDEIHRLEDARRLEAIRSMHDRHQRAGRFAISKALAALTNAAPEDIPPYAAARLLELGARLERDTLITSVEELQGLAPVAVEDPWETIARELDAVPES